MSSRAGVAKRTTAPVLKTGAPCEPMGSNPIPGATNEPTGFSEYLTRERRLAPSTVYTRERIIRSLSKRINLWDIQAARARVDLCPFVVQSHGSASGDTVRAARLTTSAAGATSRFRYSANLPLHSSFVTLVLNGNSPTNSSETSSRKESISPL